MNAFDVLGEFADAARLGRREWFPGDAFRIRGPASGGTRAPRTRRASRPRVECEDCFVLAFEEGGLRFEMREGYARPIRIGAVR